MRLTQEIRARFVALAFVLSAGWALPQLAFAQVTGGAIQGTVLDKQGAVVANAVVTITNQSTQLTTTVSTNGDGFYAATNILPGEYTLSVTAPRFATSVQSDIDLAVGQQQQINV